MNWNSIRHAVLAVILYAGVAGAQSEPWIGQECDPLDPVPHHGISCQATGEVGYYESVVLNAQKGDLLLNAACGPTADMARAANDQSYSHIGIMTEDRREIRHARVNLEPSADTAGFWGVSETRVKYGWPGVLTQTIQNAFEGHEVRPGPDGSDLLHLDSHFGANPRGACSDEDSPVAVAPLVIKPSPSDESEIFSHDSVSVRERLHEVADAARDITGHYRFYAFTEADIRGRTGSQRGASNSSLTATGWTEPGGDGTEHAHPDGMQCAAFIWHAMRAAEAPINQIRGAEELELGPAEQEGLYVYTLEARRNAINKLDAIVRSEAARQAPWFAPRIPGRLATQFVNCFAADSCDETSANGVAPYPAEGLTVSPEDITHWDAYPSGLYGHTERLRYRPGVFRRRHTWQPSEGSGMLRVNVYEAGVLIDFTDPETLVTVPTLTAGTGIPSGTVNESGYVEFAAVAAGIYEAQVLGLDRINPADGELFNAVAAASVEIRAGESHELDIDLEYDSIAPTHCDTRGEGLAVSIGGILKARDHDTIRDDVKRYEPDRFLRVVEGVESFDDELSDLALLSGPIILGPDQTTQMLRFEACADEVGVYGELTLDFDELDRSVLARLHATLAEGTAGECGKKFGTYDNEDERITEATVELGESGVPLNMDLINRGPAGRHLDKGYFRLLLESHACTDVSAMGAP